MANKNKHRTREEILEKYSNPLVDAIFDAVEGLTRPLYRKYENREDKLK